MTGTIFGIGGANATDTFDWGGGSAVNWLQDSTGLYNLGHASGDTWVLNKMDESLNVVDSRSFSAPSLGYAFMIGGNLFTSSNYYSNVVDQVLNFGTGDVSAVAFLIDGLGSPYISNTFYDPSLDALYLQNTNDGILYRISDASAAFDVSAVPEPSSLALVAIAGVGFLGIAWNRRKQAA